MATRDFFAHCDLDTGSLPWDRMTAASYSWVLAAENIAAGYSTPTSVMTGWMGSSGHRGNILSTSNREIGVGYVNDATDSGNVREDLNGDCTADSFNHGPFFHYWTQNFGTRNDIYPLVINREAYETTNMNVGLYVYGQGFAQDMRLKNETGTWSAWEPYSPNQTWTLSTGNGVKEVFVEIRDALSIVLSASDTIVAKYQDTTGVFRPSNGLIYLKSTNETGFADAGLVFGIPGDLPVMGDWNGNGVDTIGIYRDGVFYLRNSNTTGFADLACAFGQSGDLPMAGDWNGDGVDTVGIYRNGQFMLRNSNSSGPPDMTFALGVLGDEPIAGDWDGDGDDSTGVFRPTNGRIYLKNENTTGIAEIEIVFGIPNDKPTAGDWDGDGIDTIGVYRDGLFLLRNTNTTGFADAQFALGVSGDLPISGKWGALP